MCRTEVQKLIDGGQFGFVYQPTMLGKDIALALESYMNDAARTAARDQAATAIRRIVLSAWQLDMYGDLGNQEETDRGVQRFCRGDRDIKTAYAPKP